MLGRYLRHDSDPDGTTDTPTRRRPERCRISGDRSPTAGGGRSVQPSNIVAIWNRGPAGTTFVEDDGRWAATRKQHLSRGTPRPARPTPTRSRCHASELYAALTATWNSAESPGQVVPDGCHGIRMESTDLNATPRDAEQPRATVHVHEERVAADADGPVETPFSNVSITFHAVRPYPARRTWCAGSRGTARSRAGPPVAIVTSRPAERARP